MSYYISVSNGLLKDGHRKRMGSAVWEYMWFLDRTTRVDDDGIGWVLGGKPLILSELGIGHENTVSRNIHKLAKAGYITILRTPYGIKIGVYKAQKKFGHKRSTKNGGSQKVVDHPQEMVDHQQEMVDVIKTVQKTVQKTEQYAPPKVVAEFVFKDELKKLEDSNRRDLNIIALYFDFKKPIITNSAQYQTELKRCFRAAKTLEPFEDDRIWKTMDWLKKYGGFKWTLESVSKYITEDLSKLKKNYD